MLQEVLQRRPGLHVAREAAAQDVLQRGAVEGELLLELDLEEHGARVLDAISLHSE